MGKGAGAVIIGSVSEDLTHGEQLVLRLHPHGKTMVRPAFMLLLIAAVAIAVVALLPASAGTRW